MPIIHTIGYANRQPEDFFALLPPGAVVVDVRRNPVSWHGAYKRESLRRRMGERYVWLPALGNISGTRERWAPPPGLNTNAALHAVVELLRQGNPVVLLCAELKPEDCHRRFVAEALCRLLSGTRVEHL
jgi:uncharacterized protein (DUF488 family)